MKRGALFILTLLLLISLGSCKKDTNQGWVLYDSEKTLYSWVLEDAFATVIVDRESEQPEAILAASFGIPVRTIEIEAAAYDEVVKTLTHLVRVQTNNAYMEVSPQVMVEHLFAGAPALRKSRLADTLALVSGESDPLARLLDIKEVALFDLRGKLNECTTLERYLESYFLQVNRTMKRR